APASATATTMAAHPRASTPRPTIAAPNRRRRVQNGMGGKTTREEARRKGAGAPSMRLQAEPVVHLYEQDVGRRVEEHLMSDVLAKVEGRVQQVGVARLRPD